MRSFKILLGILVFLLSTSILVAQETCQLLIERMIENTQLACPELEADQVCYGNRFVTGVRIDPNLDVKFLEPGDVVDTVSHKGYQVDWYNTELEQWGIALAKVAPLPVPVTPDDEQAPPTLSMVMFGSQEVWDATRSSPIRYEGTITTVTNLLEVAGDFETAFFPTTVGETVSINAREPNNRFLRIVDARMNAGWIEMDAVSTDGDLSVLPMIDVIQGTDPSTFAPYQAIYLDRILGNPSCVDVPTSGVLIQSVHNVGLMDVLVNGVNIALDGTMYVTADAGGEMWIDLLDGQAILTNGTLIPAGARAALPLTFNFDTLLPQLVPYDKELVDKLPILLLDEQIEPVDPLTQDDIDTMQGRG